MIESLNIIYIKNVAIESTLDVKYNMLDVGRNFAKLEVTMTCKMRKLQMQRSYVKCLKIFKIVLKLKEKRNGRNF